MTSHTPVEETIALLVEVLSRSPAEGRRFGRLAVSSTLAGPTCWSLSRQISRGAATFCEVLGLPLYGHMQTTCWITIVSSCTLVVHNSNSARSVRHGAEARLCKRHLRFGDRPLAQHTVAVHSNQIRQASSAVPQVLHCAGTCITFVPAHPPPPSRPSPPLRTASSSRCHNAAGLAAVILCRHRFCHVPPQVFRSRVAHARVFDSDGRRRRARFISKKCGGRSFRSVHSVPGSHAHDLNSRSLAEMVHRLMVTAGVWSPAGGWWADPVHWRRNTALAFLCVPPCSAPLRHGCQ